MNSKKNIFVLITIVIFLVVPIIPQQQAFAKYTINEITDTKDDISNQSNLPKLLPPPPGNPNYTYDYIYSLGADYAEAIFLSIEDLFPFTNIPSNRIYDLTVVQYALTCIDLYYVTSDVNYLNSALAASLTLNLDVNGSFIVGEDLTSVYELNADENLLLVLMYERLAEALVVGGDISNASIITGFADSLLGDITALFYDSATTALNSTLLVNQSQFIVQPSFRFPSARATGLYFMANYNANDSSRFYTESKNALDFYRTFVNTSALLPTSDNGFLYYSTFSSGSASDAEADLQGNIYMNTALMQLSQYLTETGDATGGLDHFNWTTMGEEAIKEYFKSPDTSLFHTKYDLGMLVLEDVAFTYENCLYLSHLIEYKRSRLSITGINPPFMEVNDLFNEMFMSVFFAPDLFTAGITKTGANLDLIFDLPHSNPHIVNYQAITMLAKFYPLISMIAYPNQILLNKPTIFDWVFDYAETTSIFGSCNKTFSLNYQLSVSSQTILSIQHPENYRINTTILNGVRLQGSQVAKLNITTDQGGNHDVDFAVSLSGFLIFDSTLSIYVDKIIVLNTNPTNLEVTELVDKDLILTVYLEDETGLGIDNAEVMVYSDIDSVLNISKITDSGGYVTFYIPIGELIPDPLPEGVESSFNTSIEILATKTDYLPTIIYKDVNVKLNNLILDLNPSPPEVKEASDLSLYLDVTSRIPASIFNPIARLFINGIPYETSSHKSTWDLPTTVIIEKSWLRNGTAAPVIVDVLITADGLTEPQHFTFEVLVEPLGTLERIYMWIEVALRSDAVKIIGALGILWGILWRQFSLYVIKRTRRCPYCGDIARRKYPYCKNCGLKDESLEYKKKLKKDNKEARIKAAEQEAIDEPLQPIVQQSVQQPPVEQPPVEKKFDDSFGNTFDKKNDDDYNY